MLRLIPDNPPTLTYEEVSLKDLPTNDELIGPPPNRALIDSIKKFGVQQTIILSRKFNTLNVVEGRRRIKAARELGHETIPARIFNADDTEHILSLSLNSLRGSNPAVDLKAIESLLARGLDEKDIAIATGLSLATIRQRLKFQDLHPDLKAKFEGGLLSVSAAMEALKLSRSDQEKLLEKVKITKEDVRRLRVAQTEAAGQEFLSDLFEDFDGTPSIGDVEENERLKETIRELISMIEDPDYDRDRLDQIKRMVEDE